MDSFTIAEMCHEANRVLQREFGDLESPEWNELDAETKQSAREGVEAILSGQVTQPSESHEGWAQFKLQNGWVYGEEKDLEKKTHPLLVPYADLPVHQRLKDFVFFGIVQGVINAS